MRRSPVLLFAVLGSAALLVGCGSSSTTGTTSTGGAGGSKTTSSTGSKTSSTGGSKTTGTGGSATTGTGGSATTGTGGSAAGTGGSATGAGGAASCQEMCVQQNMTGFQHFEANELQYCGCKTGAACASKCTAECANPSSLTQNSPCGQCLLNEASKGMQSTCTVQGYVAKCLSDPQCSAFANCGMACP